MNSTRYCDRSPQRGKAERDAARRALEWQKREEAKRRAKAKPKP